MRCAECRSLLGGYVLDALEPGETAAVRAHVADCAACANEAARLAPVPALLDLVDEAAPLERPRPALEEAILDRHARERPAHRRRRRIGLARAPRTRRWGLATAGALAAVVAAILAGTLTGGGPAAQGSGHWATLHGLAAAPAAHGRAVLVERPVGTVVRLRAAGLRPHRAYELWCVSANGWRVTAGTFRASADGTANVRLTSAASLTNYGLLRVSRERPGPAYGTDVLAGSVQS